MSKYGNVTTCKLDNGQIVEYDACSKKIDEYDPNVFRYIGDGIIWEVNGVIQKPKGEVPRYCFYVNKKWREYK